jgi:Icc-related predicted phosphoesterase
VLRVVTSPLLIRCAAVVVIALLGGWLGLFLGGNANVQIGPVRTRMVVQPSFSGQTVVSVPPLGALVMKTNTGPFRLSVDVRQLNEQDVKALVASPSQFQDLPNIAATDLRHGVIVVAVRSLIAVTVGGLLLGLLAFRRILPALAAAGIALAVLAAGGAVAVATWNPKSVLEPRYTGLLAGAPSLVGTAQNIVIRFGLYRQELATLVTNITRLYDVTSTLPAYQPDPGTIRVLNVSDIHDNPAAWNIMHSLVKQFDIDFIIDSGDLTDHGSQPENAFAKEISTFGVPYVFVKGNHDSTATQAAVARQRNAITLTSQEVTVDGLRIIGNGDPRFTPNQSVEESGEEAVYQMGQGLATTVQQETHPPDIAVVHDPVAALPLNGLVKLVLAGHLHRRVTWMLSGSTRVFVQGSTGGAGLRALQSSPPTPLDASVLYFDRDSHQLQAWDDITIGGLGSTNAQIQRHLASDTAPLDGPVPALSPFATPSPGCVTPSSSASATPSGSASATPCASPSAPATPSGASPPASRSP